MTVLKAPILDTPILREVRSNHRSPAGVHLVARDYPKGMRIDPHLHRESQLIYAARGTMQVTTPGGRWLVPPDRAVWVPAGLEHAIDLLADIEMRTLYFDLAWLTRAQLDRGLSREFVVRVSPLLNQAILALFDSGNTEERTELLVRLVMLELHQAEDSTTFVPLPREPRCRRAALIVLDDPTGAHDIDTLARAVGTSARTLSRLFSTQTQLSFKSWCQRARVAAAIELLSTDPGVSVKQLATQLGYASVPAFSAAFRQVTGRTPTEFAGKG
jgi:AraC-like DNA-binding protein